MLTLELGMFPSQMYKWRRKIEVSGNRSFSGQGNLKITAEQERTYAPKKTEIYQTEYN